ncbi:glycosyl transferase, family 2 [Lachnospiraceae bacterium KM106-2]|nr:glycosyl transferase, family 2 [Lachnospiraceae bacterium KM106-2]
MKSIGIVICNYNKEKDIVNCIQSVLESNTNDFDIYVVDNASTDHSVSEIKKRFQDQVTVIENKENLGGSGGFNTGLRIVVEKGYRYIVCLDNDILVDENAIRALYECMEANPEIGMLGSKVYHMEHPDYVQQYGLNLDFENSVPITLCADVLEDGSMPEIMYCDTVATCSVMIRGTAAKEVGIMPEDNFIYWDDMEWGYRINLAGYKIAAYSKSVVLHAMGATDKSKSAFTTYYIWRNWINFFIHYAKEEDLARTSLNLLTQFYYNYYETMYNEKHGIAQTMMYAYDDVLHGVRGKADPEKLICDEPAENKLERILKGISHIAIHAEDHIEDAEFLSKRILQINPNMMISYDTTNDTELNFKICDDIFKIKEDALSCIYVDTNDNILADSDDLSFIKNYEFSLQLFLYQQQPLFLKCAKALRELKR